MVNHSPKLGVTVRRFRVARDQDLPKIYQIQNIPFREKTATEALLPLDDYVEAAIERVQKGTAHYYVLEENGISIGYTQYLQEEQDWHVGFWGKWLNTLVYASSRTAFEHHGFEKLISSVRHANSRMVKTCERFGIRITGQTSVCNIQPGFSFVAVGKLNYIEITAEEFQKKCEFMRSQSLPLTFDWYDC